MTILTTQTFPYLRLMAQVYCVFLFFIAACSFGTLISKVNDILQSLNREKSALEVHLDRYISFMSEYRSNLWPC